MDFLVQLWRFAEARGKYWLLPIILLCSALRRQGEPLLPRGRQRR